MRPGGSAAIVDTFITTAVATTAVATTTTAFTRDGVTDQRHAVVVEAEGARGAVQPANDKRGEKVAVFDEALARVNERLGAVSDAE